MSRSHPELKQALYKVPHRNGIAGTAAQFAWHVSDLMNKDRGVSIVAHAGHLRSAKAQVALTRRSI